MTTDLIAALREKLVYLSKMRRNLEYSHSQIAPWWKVDANFDAWGDERLESLAAFKARFAEMQDHLGSAMKQIALIEQEDTRQFTYVLNYMTQLFILDGMEQWLELRVLRNSATHDYSASEETKALHFHRLFQNVNYLFETHNSLVSFVKRAYPEA